VGYSGAAGFFGGGSVAGGGVGGPDFFGGGFGGGLGICRGGGCAELLEGENMAVCGGGGGGAMQVGFSI
jgi:hypothetical protein